MEEGADLVENGLAWVWPEEKNGVVSLDDSLFDAFGCVSRVVFNTRELEAVHQAEAVERVLDVIH
ncbi:hypothetical protein BC936DRAFT_145453 [Jimgerdemannia flammicorona]|uniref:Uncharacterized protein n=2 Tax=Jimgerdemannia flammicorona TaxID=994334 RepID=A0A433QY28_9FUNG|nr:hypothetical protein BC936DRAFT_145453 [Jimgerdemannia flammicorona]RUS34719.1 hypothetical protein BC938DRAFT_478967 [Jimgerdemannia flammicorona]